MNIVGHSGGDNTIALAKENPQVLIDLLITLDTQDPKIYGVDDNNVPSNVKNAINYYQTEESVGGERLDFTNSTNGVNILSPGSNHRSIDNDQFKNVISDINNFASGFNAVKIANQRYQLENNPQKKGIGNIGGITTIKNAIVPKTIR